MCKLRCARSLLVLKKKEKNKRKKKTRKGPLGLGNPQRRCRFGEPLFFETPKHRKPLSSIVFSGIGKTIPFESCRFGENANV